MASNYVHKSLLKHVAKERDDARADAKTAQHRVEELVGEVTDLKMKLETVIVEGGNARQELREVRFQLHEARVP